MSLATQGLFKLLCLRKNRMYPDVFPLEITYAISVRILYTILAVRRVSERFMAKSHSYRTTVVVWTGNSGLRTRDYRAYKRDFVVRSETEPDNSWAE